MNFKLEILQLANTANFDAFFIVQVAISDRFFDDFQKVVSIQVAIDIQFANVLNRLRFGIDFLAQRKGPNGIG